MTESPDVRPEVPIDWLFAVRHIGLVRANHAEDYRLELEKSLGRPGDLVEALDALGETNGTDYSDAL